MANLYRVKYTRTITEVAEGIVEGSDKAVVQQAVEQNTDNQLVWESHMGLPESVTGVATVNSIEEFVGSG